MQYDYILLPTVPEWVSLNMTSVLMIHREHIHAGFSHESDKLNKMLDSNSNHTEELTGMFHYGQQQPDQGGVHSDTRAASRKHTNLRHHPFIMLFTHRLNYTSDSTLKFHSVHRAQPVLKLFLPYLRGKVSNVWSETRTTWKLRLQMSTEQ